MKSKTVLLLAAILLISTNAHLEEFEKFTFWDPYFIIVAGPGHAPPCINDTTGLAPDSYFAQLDSLGITLTLSVVDSQSTNNPYGIKIWGQGLTKPRINAGGLAGLVNWANNIYAEAEHYYRDSMGGAFWDDHGKGQRVQEDTLGYMLYRSGADSPGLVLTSQGVKFRPSWSTALGVRTRAKVWDTSTPDTIFHISMHYKNWDSVWVTDTAYFTGQDFSQGDPGQWQLLFAKSIRVLGGAPFGVEFYWYGNDSLAIDKLVVYNTHGQVLDATTVEEFESAFADFYNDINVEGHGKFYAADEPLPIQYFGILLFDYFASARAYPTHRTVQAVNKDFPYYIYGLDPDDMLCDLYEIRAYHDSSTSCSVGSCSIQDAYDRLASGLRERAQHILPQGIDFWIYLQAGLQKPTHDSVSHRDPTPNEIKAQAYLALAYGVSGIGYWPYSQLYFPDDSCDEPVVPFNIPMHKTPPSPDKANDPRYNGLVDWNFETERYEVNERWWAAKEAYEFIDSIWVTLKDLQWRGAASWNNVKSIDGSIIDSVYSTTFPAESTYIEVARFTSVGGDEYYMFVNRRTLSWESQNVIIQLSHQPGMTHFYDVYKDITYDVVGCNIVRFNAHFESGQLRLFKVQPDTLTSDCCVGIRGDVNGDGNYYPNVADITYLCVFLFLDSGQPLCCDEEADVNGDGRINVVDLTYLVDYLFRGGMPPLPCL
jgi:hypothetical protein